MDGAGGPAVALLAEGGGGGEEQGLFLAEAVGLLAPAPVVLLGGHGDGDLDGFGAVLGGEDAAGGELLVVDLGGLLHLRAQLLALTAAHR